MLFFIIAYSQSWIQLDDFPATERDDGVSFVIGDIAYCGTGYRTGWVETNDFYALNMNTDTWDTIASLGSGNERQYASGFSSYEQGFVFGGINDGLYLNDIWNYDPVLNTWTEKTALPSVGRSGAASFEIDGIGYVIGGKTDSSDAIDEVWAYDIENDSWEQKGDLPFGNCFRASASDPISPQNDRGYLLFGKDENNNFYNDLYEYDPSLDTWTGISEFPESGRTHSTLISMPINLVVVGGIDSASNYYNDMWRFNFDLFIWQQLDSLPASGRKGGLSYTNGIDVYYTTGINQENTRLKETWKSTSPTSIEEVVIADRVFIYPNPVSEKINIEIADFISNQDCSFTIFDISGKILKTESITQVKMDVDASALSNGLYFIQIQDGEELFTLKFIKR